MPTWRTPLLKIGMQFGAALADNRAVPADKGSLHKFPREAKASDYEEIEEPYERGTLLTSAFLEAFLGAYYGRTRDLLRLNGGEPVKDYIHPDLGGAVGWRSLDAGRPRVEIVYRGNGLSATGGDDLLRRPARSSGH